MVLLLITVLAFCLLLTQQTSDIFIKKLGLSKEIGWNVQFPSKIECLLHCLLKENECIGFTFDGGYCEIINQFRFENDAEVYVKGKILYILLCLVFV